MSYIPESSENFEMNDVEHIEEIDINQADLFTFLYERWHSLVRKLVIYLRKHKWNATAVVIGTILAEPHHALRAGILKVLGRDDNFTHYGMNPDSLTPEQAKLPAVLLIHGNFDNQRAWLTLGKRLEKEGIRVVFTLNLPNGSFTRKDKEILEEKWDHIHALYQTYGETPHVDVIGHSRGSLLAMRMNFHKEDWTNLENHSKECRENLRRRKGVGKTIILGGRPFFVLEKQLYENHNGQLFEINAKHDLLLNNNETELPNHQKVTVVGGHLGLTFSHEAVDHIIRFLKNPF